LKGKLQKKLAASRVRRIQPRGTTPENCGFTASGLSQVMDLCGRVWRFFGERVSSRAGSRGAETFSAGALSLAILALAMAVRLVWLPAAAHAQDLTNQDLPKPSDVVKMGTLKLGGMLKPGATSQLEVEAEILSGWHINSNHPNSADFIPTVLAVNPPAGLKTGAVKYPPADEIAPAFSGGEKLSVFTGTMNFTAALDAAPGFKPDSGSKFVVTLEYQPCNENICMPPAKVSASASLGSLQAAAAMAIRPPIHPIFRRKTAARMHRDRWPIFLSCTEC
jgi:Disulphide bond corrector protein DsbC